MKTIKTLLMTLASASLLAACGGGDDSFDDRVGLADPKLRFVHAAEAAPAVTLSRNDVAQSYATNVGYRYASPYNDVSTGNNRLVVRTATGDVQIGGTRDFVADRGHKYSLFAVRDGLGADLVFVDDPFNKPLTNNDAHVRVVNGSSNAASFDLYITAPGADISTAGPTVAAVPFKQARPASGSDSIDLEGGSYQVRATTPGTKTVIFNATVALARGADWVFVSVPTSVVGTLVPNAIKMLLVRPDDPNNQALVIQSS